MKKIFKNKAFLFTATYFILALFSLNWFGDFDYVLAGDLSWPISFSNFFHYSSYFWDDSVNFGYSASRQLSSIFPYASWGAFFEILGFKESFIQRFIFYLSFAFSGAGTYLLAKKFSIGSNGAFISGLIYMFSPYAMIVAWNPSYGLTFPFYCFLPLILYFFANFLTENKAWVKTLNLLGIIISFFGSSYSNPSFFMLFLGFVLFIFIYFYYQLIHLRKKLLKNFFIFLFFYFFINLYWILPFIYDIGNQYASSSNEAGGLISDAATMKLNSVFINEALRSVGLWTLGARISGESYYDWINLYNSIFYIFSGFILIIIGIIPFISKNKTGLNRKLILSMLFILILGVLLNSGFKNAVFSNNIVNYIFFSDYFTRAYRSIYLKFGVLLVFPISFLAGYFFDFLKIKNQKTEMVILLVFSFFFLYFTAKPFLNGQIIKKTEGDFISSFAVSIPDEYYSFKLATENIKLDARYLSLPIPRSYNLSLKWENEGFQGADFLRFFLQKPLVFMNDGSPAIKSAIEIINTESEDFKKKLCGLLGINYFFIHKDINEFYDDTYLTKNEAARPSENIIYNSKYFEVTKINNDFFLPHFYTPKNSIVSQRTVEDLPKIISSDDWQIRSTIFFRNQNTDKTDELNSLLNNKTAIDNLPVLEFKKINPIKYRVRVHSASEIFPLVFSESFHDGWEMYLAKTIQKTRNDKQKTNLTSYKILDENSENQATKDELQNHINNSHVTTLGDLQEKIIEHKKWIDGKEKLNYIEKYNIDFISKNFQGTIQNDNLPDGNIWETWFQKPIENNNNHLIANGYANSWVIDSEKICGMDSRFRGNDNFSCIKNPDGSYDFEIVVEFWPQRLFYLGLFISGMTLFGCIVFLGYDWKKRQKILDAK